MDPQTVGLYGGIASGVVGVIGGLVGTATSVLNTHGPRERVFAVRCAVVLWVVMAVSLTAAFLLPGPFRSLATLPLLLALPWAVRAGNRRLAGLRQEDVRDGGGSVSNTEQCRHPAE